MAFARFFCMGPMQLSALAHSVESGTSVNCMKFIMVSFLGLSVTTEASGAYMNWVSAAQFMLGEKDSLPTILALFVPCSHYLTPLAL